MWGVPTAFMASFILPLLESGGCPSHQLSKPLTWTKPHSAKNAAPHPSAVASLHLTGGTSQDTGEWWQHSLLWWSLSECHTGSRLLLCVLR